MSNMEKYRNAFAEAFEMKAEDVEGLVYQETEKWDSVGHMILTSALEETFGTELEPEEMLALTSFQKGIAILKDKGINL